ncbi:MAG TPA: peptidylprolyl isomerase [Chitinophagales bacterium]|jgi:peptidyl-prolyl cis-trans isomerase B (cyclophilin B)|nr:peptidylprolyl isomerase [Chitinophagales bacterium]
MSKQFLALIVLCFALMSACKNNQKTATITTDYGTITVKLYNETPQHRDNFLKLANEGFYNGTLFHRVISEFMIQGGDPDSKNATPEQMLGQGEPGYTIPAELVPKLYHKRGALCAARKGDQINPEKQSSGSQFYIVQGKKWTDIELQQIEAMTGTKFGEVEKKTYKEIGGTPMLDGKYTVFGEVISGMEVVDKIAEQPTGPADRPLQDVKMTIKMNN